MLGSAQICVAAGGTRVVASGDYKDVADPTCAPFELIACDAFITEATFGLPVFRHGDPRAEITKLLRSVELFPERGHLVGAYSLGKAQRVIALIRAAGYDKPIYLHGAMESITNYYVSRGIDLGELRAVRDTKKADLAGAIALCPPSSLQDRWTRRFPDPVSAFASGWMRVRARARQRGVELPMVISDHADWDGLTATIAATGASQIWVTHGAEEALVHWCTMRGLEARPLNIVGYGDEDEEAVIPGRDEVASPESINSDGTDTDGSVVMDPGQPLRGFRDDEAMNRFAALLDRLAYEPSRNAKLRLLTGYFRETPDPDRGYALAAITGALSFRHAKPGIIRALIAERTDPMLFELSYDYVGDLSETVALMWPVIPPLQGEGGREAAGWGSAANAPPGGLRPPPSPFGGGMKQAPSLSHVVTTLASLGKSELPAQLAAWLDALDETGRWALLKLVTGALRIGVSARLAKTAGRGARRQGARRGRAGLARSRAALRASCSPGSKAAPRSRSASIRRRSAR